MRIYKNLIKHFNEYLLKNVGTTMFIIELNGNFEPLNK